MIDIFQEINPKKNIAKIKVLGVGGAGNNMVNSMINSGYDQVTYLVANTDAQALDVSKAIHKIQLGTRSTKGLGAGANPEVGRRAAEEDIDHIIETIGDADIVFLTGGMGGGTGSGALPVIARALKERDVLTIAVVTKPFIFEGKRRMKTAQDAIENLQKDVDTLIVIPNQKLLEIAGEELSLIKAFELINSSLNQFIGTITDIITKPGHMNVDFADIKTVMKQKGHAFIGIGRASGAERAEMAALSAIKSTLIDTLEMEGAKGVLVNISGGINLGLHELNRAVSIIHEHAHEDASIIVGSVFDEKLMDEILITIIATGFNNNLIENKELVKTYQADSLIKTSREISSKLNNKNQNVVSQEIDLTDLDIPAVLRRAAKEIQF